MASVEPSTSGAVAKKTLARRLRIPSIRTPSVRSPARPNRGPKKKALLIGINYDTPEVAQNVSDEFGPLRNPRQDVGLMRDLLINVYGYKAEDITMMVEGLDDRRLLPTKANIEREAARLVYGAKPGDRFVFLFSGHSDQVENKTGSEDDGKDERMVALDAKIIDNKLNRLLVQPLPVGAHLTAILDACHSGTMLDLVHDKCNRIYVPWISKGQRLTEKTRWMTICRKNATFSREPMLTRLLSAKRRNEYAMDVSLDVMAAEFTKFSQVPLPPLPSTEPQPEPTAPDTPTTRKRRVTLSQNFKLAKAASKSRVRTKSKRGAPLRPRAVTISHSQLKGQPSVVVVPASARGPEQTELEKHVTEGAYLCQSPVSMIKCDGFCQRDALPMPHVVSLAACSDPQMAWEGRQGQSMTQTLVNYLQHDPHPTYRQLHEAMSFGIYNTVSRQLHYWSKLKHQRFKAKAANGHPVPQHPRLEQVNFQDFQMSSQQKMNLDDTYEM